MVMGKFKVGDKVRVLKQTNGWGSITMGDIGVVISVMGSMLHIDFKNQSNWMGDLECFELIEDETTYNKDIQYEVY